jgi:hypothetical protein
MWHGNAVTGAACCAACLGCEPGALRCNVVGDLCSDGVGTTAGAEVSFFAAIGRVSLYSCRRSDQ